MAAPTPSSPITSRPYQVQGAAPSMRTCARVGSGPLYQGLHRSFPIEQVVNQHVGVEEQVVAHPRPLARIASSNNARLPDVTGQSASSVRTRR